MFRKATWSFVLLLCSTVVSAETLTPEELEDPALSPGLDSSLSSSSTDYPANGQALGTETGEWARRIKHAESLGALGTDLFGDSTNFYNGSTTFSVTDIDLPGNNSLPVRVGRTREAAELQGKELQGMMADWELDIPYMSGVYAQGFRWQVSSAQPNNRCSSGELNPITVNTFDGDFYGREYFRGVTLYVPGHGAQTVLTPSAANSSRPTDGQVTQFVTNQFWQVRCLAALANPGSGNAGEGFLVLAPDGTKYWFNWMTHREFAKLVRSHGPTDQHVLYREEVRIYPTRVEDRFGNYVTYNYAGSKLTSIAASDGRAITLDYNASGYVWRATAHGKQWIYSYLSDVFELSGVTLPDGSTWTIATYQLLLEYDPTGPDPGCHRPDSLYAGLGRTFSFKHPSGAVGNFTFSPTRHGRSQIPLLQKCSNSLGEDNRTKYGPPILTDNFALTRKVISGPSLPAQEWVISYEPAQGGYEGEAVPDTRWIEVLNPDQSRTKYTFGIRFHLDEGKLLRTQTFEPVTNILSRDEWHTYDINPTSPVYPYLAGLPGLFKPDAFAATNIVPRKSTTIIQSGTNYYNVVNAFDQFAREASVTRSNTIATTPPLSRTDVLAYHDNLNRWVLGQLKSSTTNNGVIDATEFSTEYGAVSVKPEKVFRFGVLQNTASYRADGTLEWVKDPLNAQTSFSSWKRGVPQTITFPDDDQDGQSTASAVVNELGWVTSVDDERETTTPTTYGYDAGGRVSSIDYPQPDTVVWARKTITTAPLSAAEGIFPAGTWRSRSTVGNFQRTVWHDGRFNPVYEEEKDLTTGLARYVRRAYDHEGRMTFESYPSEVPQTLAGINSEYDAIGRLIRRWTTDNIELERIEYIADNGKRITDADGKVTTIYYQAFDKPDYSKPIRIVAPEGQTTEINRGVFGLIGSVVQSGNWSGGFATATRTFGYDSGGRLIRRTDPESGSTCWGYNAASQIVWELKGVGGTVCPAQAPVPAGATEFAYHPRGWKKQDNHPGTAEDVYYEYDPVGNVESITNSFAAWDYEWNKRNLVETETASIDGKTFLLNPAYDALAHRSSLTTPSNQAINYFPNAWGEPTRFGIAVTNILYHPNGLAKSYTLGNGLSYSLTLDNRRRPWVQDTRDGGTSIQSYTYGYSDAGDLELIDDTVGDTDDLYAEYDNLHRLKKAIGIWGTYEYAYDSLNNLRSRTGGAGTLTYNYNAFNQLSTITGALSRTYNHTARGHIFSDGSKLFTLNSLGQITAISGNLGTYVYDGRAKRIKSIKSTGTEYALYDLAGSLVYTENGTTKTDFLTLNGKPVVEVNKVGTTTTLTYLHSDLLGSPRAATSATKAFLWQEHYDPYGKRVNGTGSKLGYTGHAHDAETGYTYMQARFYDAQVGRFLSIDPIDFQETNPFTFNRYSYANNNPYRFLDPSGLASEANLCSRVGSGSCAGSYAVDDLAEFRDGSPGQQQLRQMHEKGQAVAAVGETAVEAVAPFPGISKAKGVFGVLGAILGKKTARAIGKAPEFGGGKVSEAEFLHAAERWLGPGYKSLPNGRYVSGDGLRQVRYGRHETKGQLHHGHFEAYDSPAGKVIETTTVEITP